MQIESKLPDVGTNIFSIMSGMAKEYKAINLAQGFPNFDAPEELLRLVQYYLYAGNNQYAPMLGIESLRSVIAEKIYRLYGFKLDIREEICISSGASEGLFTAISALVPRGSEVIVLEPSYDLYGPAISLAGAKKVTYTMEGPEFRVMWDDVARLITDNTSMIIINSPHNPTGKTISRKDLEALYDITKNTNITILSDEVYEHLVFDDKKHESILSHEGLRERSLAISSFGKTFHCTGWKIGYIAGTKSLMKEFVKVHQFNVFCVPHFIQHALADYLQDSMHYESLPKFYEKKRDLFQSLMTETKFTPLKSEGSFFQLYDYSSVSNEDDLSFAKRLTKDHGVAAIPISSFYDAPPKKQYIRFCFAKTEDTLIEAAKRLSAI